MKIVVMGGNGLVGRKLVARLRAAGQEAVAASRSTGVDLLTGAGLDQVLEGADVVVDLSNLGYGDAEAARAFFELAGRNLFSAEIRAGVGHHVTLSAVGTDLFPDSGYFRAKAAQEQVVVGGGVPYTIVRATPFFEFIYNIVDDGGVGDLIRLPPIQVQPMAAADVARALVRIVLQDPLDGIVELAGPHVRHLGALAEDILTANEDTRTVVIDIEAQYFGTRVGAQRLVGGRRPHLALTTFDDWLRASLQPLRIGAAE